MKLKRKIIALNMSALFHTHYTRNHNNIITDNYNLSTTLECLENRVNMQPYTLSSML